MSAIEWTDETWNPTVGCSRVSPGCEHCYAERVAHRAMQPAHEGLTTGGHGCRCKNPGQLSEAGRWSCCGATDAYRPPRWNGTVRLLPERLDQPLRWRKPRRVFVDSMSDLFHESVPDSFIDQVFAAMAQAPRHTFQVLTKRPERMRAWFDGGEHLRMTRCFRNFTDYTEPVGPWPLPNVWLGVSVEDQERADERIPLLLETPAAVRFISAEPLLGPVDLECFGATGCPTGWLDDDPVSPALDWVIVGGESGPGARPCNVEWIRSIVRQCADAGVPAFVKQLGVYVVAPDAVLAEWPTAEWRGDPATGLGRAKLQHGKGAASHEWPADLRVRSFPTP